MSSIWVYREDGSIQCEDVAGEALDEAREDLARLIGESEILKGEKRYLPMIELCGMPTGAVNSFEISLFGWMVLSRGIVGTAGFKRWPETNVPFKQAATVESEPQGGEVPFPFSADNKESPLPTVLRALTNQLTIGQGVCAADLVGRNLRVYEIGDFLTLDWQPNRVNIGLNDKGKIADVWFG